MKNRILIAALAAFTLFAGSAWAIGTPVSVFTKFDDVKFRAQVAANPASIWDSTVTSRVGAAGASSVLDTTVAISTEGWVIPINQAINDTSGVFCTLIVHDATAAGDCESGADSLAVAMQVSADGVTWTTLAAVAAQAAPTTNPITSRNNQTIASGTFHDRLSMNGAALAAGQPIWAFKFKMRSVTPLDGSNVAEAYQFPYIRFVLSFHDAKGYIVQAKVFHQMAVNP